MTDDDDEGAAHLHVGSRLRQVAGDLAREVAEMALAHVIPDAVEAAYPRGDLFEKRRNLMNAWAAYCAKVQTDAEKVVALAPARTPR
jgi:hypothetical protein